MLLSKERVVAPAFPRRIVCTLILAAFVAAGCGGSEGGQDDQPSISKEEFIVRADAICSQAHEQVSALGPAPGESAEVAPRTDWLSQFAAIGDIALEDLRALPPADDQETIDDMLAAYGSSFLAIEDVVIALRAGNGQAVLEAFGRELSALHEAENLASDYGLEACTTVGRTS